MLCQMQDFAFVQLYANRFYPRQRQFVIRWEENGSDGGMVIMRRLKSAVQGLSGHPYLLLSMATLFWGSNFVLGRTLVQVIPPFHLSCLRWMIAGLIVLPFAWQECQRHRRTLLNHWKILLLMALTGIAGFNSLLYVALQYTTSINASLVNSTAPLLIVLLSVLFLNEKLVKVQYAGVLLSFAGVVWVISRGQLNHLLALSFNTGDLFVILAVISWAVYSILMKKYGPLLPKKATFFVTICLGVLILMPISFWESMTRSFEWQRLSAAQWLGTLYLSVFPTVVSFICWNEGVMRVGPSLAANFLHLIVVYSAIFAFFVGETYSLVQLTGAVLIVGGVLLVTNHRFFGQKFKGKQKKIDLSG